MFVLCFEKVFGVQARSLRTSKALGMHDLVAALSSAAPLDCPTVPKPVGPSPSGTAPPLKTATIAAVVKKRLPFLLEIPLLVPESGLLGVFRRSVGNFFMKVLGSAPLAIVPRATVEVLVAQSPSRRLTLPGDQDTSQVLFVFYLGLVRTVMFYWGNDMMYLHK